MTMKNKQFKSYYVVWKRLEDIFFNLFDNGLNRTMQYGNEETDGLEQIICDGLNRTMQYGNGYTNVGENEESVGLNRTMQYGNCREIFGKINDIGV